MPMSRLGVIELKTVYQRQHVHIDHHGIELGALGDLTKLLDPAPLGGGEQHLHLPTTTAPYLSRGEDLKIGVDIVDVKRDVLFGFVWYGISEFFRGHPYHLDFLDDYRMPGKGQRHISAGDFFEAD